MQEPRATAVIVHGDITFKDYAKYARLAEENDLKFTVRHDPKFKGEVGLVVVSDQAIT